MMDKIHAPTGYEMKVSSWLDEEFWIDGCKRVSDECYKFVNGPHMPTKAEAIAEWNALFQAEPVASKGGEL